MRKLTNLLILPCLFSCCSQSDIQLKPISRKVGVLLIVDKSGSMAGVPIESEKEACLAAIEELRLDDKVGIIAFDWNARLIAPLEPAHERASITIALKDLRAEGSTRLGPALTQAARIFSLPTETEAFAAKRIIVISDGNSQVKENYEDILNSLVAGGVLVSTIRLSWLNGNPGVMDDIARLGHGHAFSAENPHHLSCLMAKEVLRLYRDVR